MANDDLIEVEGEVIDVYPGGHFLVRTVDGNEVKAHLSGKMRSHAIRVVLGDKVTVGISPYDLTKGRITYRQK